MALQKSKRRQKIKARVRARISGSSERPRLSVFRSNKVIYAQIIDDEKGHTLAASSSVSLGTLTVENAKQVGQQLAEKAKTSGITKVVFDRNGYLYHGRIKALAEGAREGGLIF